MFGMKFWSTFVAFPFIISSTLGGGGFFQQGCANPACQVSAVYGSLTTTECLLKCDNNCVAVKLDNPRNGRVDTCSILTQCYPNIDELQQTCREGILWKNKCPKLMVEINGQCYILYKIGGKSPAAADAYCQSKGYKLIEINSNEEITNILAVMPAGAFWLANRATVYTQKDHFFLADGTTPVTIDRKFWARPTEPNSLDSPCVYMARIGMNDVPCSEAWPAVVICETGV